MAKNLSRKFATISEDDRTRFELEERKRKASEPKSGSDG